MSSGTDQRAQEQACPSCGAMVRRGLVRCWNCSAFMKPEIAAAYERMQANEPDSSFRPLPEHEPDPGSATTTTAGDQDQESGFELDASFTMTGTEPRVAQAGSTNNEGQSEKSETKPAAEKGRETSDAGESADSEETPRGAKKDRPGKSEEADTGDSLLKGALQEEKEIGSRSRAAFDPVCVEGGWMITCPCPAHVRIKVREGHRGKTGKCPNPNCGSYFTVPANLPEPKGVESADEAEEGFPADPAEAAGPYTHWLRDVRLHVVKPAKARRKSGGHEKEFQPADLAFSKNDGMAAISLASKPNFLGKARKPEDLRQEIVTELKEGKATDELSSEAVFAFAPETLSKLLVEYPPAYEHESTFAGVPVFGADFITVKLPPAGADDEQHFIALTLTQYRRLRELLGGLFQQDQLGAGCPIPEDDETVSLECHFSGKSFSVLRNPAFHVADPEITLEEVAWRCESCGMIVSEESRKEKKIGGEEGKKLASAKCPQCKGKFGKTPLYALDSASEESASGPPADAEETGVESGV